MLVENLSYVLKTCPTFVPRGETTMHSHSQIVYNSPCSRGRIQIRSGFTLVELLLVLSLMVVLAALAIPALHRPLLNYKLRKAGDQVRTLFGKSQLRAIRSGQTQVLVFLPGSGQVQIQTLTTDQDMLEASPQTNVLGSPQIGGTSNPNITSLQALSELLPEGVVFVEAVTTDDTRDAYTQQQNAQSGANSQMGAGLSNEDLLQQGGVPLMFYPDGTSSTGRVIITNNLDAFVVLDLRGLTGVAQVSDLLSASDVSAP